MGSPRSAKRVPREPTAAGPARKRCVTATPVGERPGHYELRVDPGLEDLAGNTLRRAFETPVTSAVGAAKVVEEIRLPFRVGAVSD